MFLFVDIVKGGFVKIQQLRMITLVIAGASSHSFGMVLPNLSVIGISFESEWNEDCSDHNDWQYIVSFGVDSQTSEDIVIGQTGSAGNWRVTLVDATT